MASVPPAAAPSQPASKPRPAQKKITIRNPPFTYLHLTLHAPSAPSPPPDSPPPDILTARAHLTSALGQFLGITGTAVPVDFLKVAGGDVWIRVPRDDAGAVAGALSQWVGKDGESSWRVRRKGEWLGAVVATDGHELFQP